jgi:hypothetical protein
MAARVNESKEKRRARSGAAAVVAAAQRTAAVVGAVAVAREAYRKANTKDARSKRVK